ncbi:hypothetical protein AB0E63_07995 [Kribbella sp. NPDC026596]
MSSTLTGRTMVTPAFLLTASLPTADKVLLWFGNPDPVVLQLTRQLS